MQYLVTEVTEDTISLWDQETMDKNRPKRMGGIITLSFPGAHGIMVGRLVEIEIKLVPIVWTDQGETGTQEQDG